MGRKNLIPVKTIIVRTIMILMFYVFLYLSKVDLYSTRSTQWAAAFPKLQFWKSCSASLIKSKNKVAMDMSGN